MFYSSRRSEKEGEKQHIYCWPTKHRIKWASFFFIVIIFKVHNSIVNDLELKGLKFQNILKIYTNISIASITLLPFRSGSIAFDKKILIPFLI